MKAVKINLGTGEGIKELIDIINGAKELDGLNDDDDVRDHQMAMRIRHISGDIFRARNREQFNKFYEEEFKPGLLLSFEKTMDSLMNDYEPILGKTGVEEIRSKVKESFAQNVVTQVPLTEKDVEKGEKLMAKLMNGELVLNL